MHMASERGRSMRQILLDECWTTHRWPSRGGSDSDLFFFAGNGLILILTARSQLLPASFHRIYQPYVFMHVPKTQIIFL
jgi:hypothetical protein